MMPLRRRVIIFDLDGTLIDSLPATFKAFQEAVEPFIGRRPAVSEILDRFGPADHRIVSDWVGPGSAAAALERLYAAYARESARVGPFPGMRDLLEDLSRAGRRLALFTGRGRPSTDLLLDSTKLSGFFEATVTGEEAERPKPFPDGLLRVLDLLGACAEDAVYVGDTVKDAEAARSAGMAMIAAVWGSPEPERLRRLERVAERVEDLRAMLFRSRTNG